MSEFFWTGVSVISGFILGVMVTCAWYYEGDEE
jgi:hypothetical protein